MKSTSHTQVARTHTVVWQCVCCHTYSLTRWFARSPACSFRSFVCSLVCLLVRWFIRFWFARSFPFLHACLLNTSCIFSLNVDGSLLARQLMPSYSASHCLRPYIDTHCHSLFNLNRVDRPIV